MADNQQTRAATDKTADKQNKRRRVTRACDACKSRKRRCTGDVPCTSCASHNVECTYTSSYNRGKLVEPSPSGRLNGLRRDTIRDEYVAGASTTRLQFDSEDNSGPKTGAFAGQYLGPSSPYSFLRRAWKRFGTERHKYLRPDDEDDEGVDSTKASIFQHGDRQPPEHRTVDRSLLQTPRVRTLVSRYFEFASPTYRFLHEPSVLEWLGALQLEDESTMLLSRSKMAVSKLVIAIAILYEEQGADVETAVSSSNLRSGQSESLYQDAKADLDKEHGRPSIYAAQARLTICQYLLCTSRPSEAWYSLGVAIQLIMALGIHRRLSLLGPEPNVVIRECRKRVFWTTYVLDTYLSAMLGRPHLIHDDDIDQDLPMAIDDGLLENGKDLPITAAGDCSMTAAVLHARLVAITKRASKAQNVTARRDDAAYMTLTAQLSEQLSEWKRSLPVFLSGAVHPTTLMPVYRRQLIVLSLAHAHAAMLIGRHFIITEFGTTSAAQGPVDECLRAAQICLDIVMDMADQHRSYTAFWNTHYITFSALTIVYVWIIQRKNERLPVSKSVEDEAATFDLAEQVRIHLSTITVDIAPSLRYSIILEELSQEAIRWRSRSADQSGAKQQNLANNDASDSLLSGIEIDDSIVNVPPSATWDTPLYFPSDLDLWSQLDTISFTNIDLAQF